jgi:hypothetical protein
MPGFCLKGGLIQFTRSFPLPVPKVIVFQYNPETMTHGWTPATASPGTPGHPGNPLAVTGQPQETFSFTLAMDSNDDIADGNPASAGIAEETGVYARLAALEMLLFPVVSSSGGLVGTVTATLGFIGGRSATPKQQVPPALLPMVLLVWGPGRILPVRVAALSITEKLYDATLLNPTHVEAQITLRVLTQDELKYLTGPLGALAYVAYSYSQALRGALAITNQENAGSSIIGMLPV